ncbi:MAG: PEP-utilizing enzyme [Patescibacteria group bacterium]|jgi:phosphohistidine swiveling domain-containing protein
MATKKIVFHKNFTRDTTLLLQQLWPICMEDGLMEIVPRNPYRPSVVDHMHNGTIEIWENDRAVDYIKKQFIKFSRKNPREALRFLERFKAKNKPLADIWRRGVLGSLKELKDFVALVLSNMVGDLFVLYMAEEKSIPPAVRRRAYSLRDGDHYFSSSNKVLVSTIKKLFPEIKDYANAVRFEDLDNIPSRAELKRRYKNYICVANKYAKVETLTAYARKTGYQFIEEKATAISRGLKGQAANPGQVRGRVKLVFTTRDLDKVKKGDILVSPMTTANFMPALKKAAAIITDEGGLLCHAAIVSRELKKPCLIATKAATKFFKDNDLVEVDVEAGWVRKIK